MKQLVTMLINGSTLQVEVEPRVTMLEMLREDLRLTGTHAGCEHGACGACTVIIDGDSVRSCLMLAVQVDGCEVTTIEGVAVGKALHPVQQAFSDHHGLQCGYCTPGIVMSSIELLGHTPNPTRDEIARALVGNLCRCTGYTGIVDAITALSERMCTGESGGQP